MDIVFIITFMGLSVIFFALYLVFSMSNYKKRFSEKYDLRNHFPYEFNFSSRFSDNILGNVALLFATTLSVAFFGVALALNVKSVLTYSIVISGVLFSLLICFINFVPLKTIRFHMVTAILLFICSFFLPASIALSFFQNYQTFGDALSLVLFIICIVVSLFSFGLSMNPKLSLNIKMNVTTDDQGKEYYVRPKFIIFALTEWLMILSIIVDDILFIVLLNVIK